MAPTFGLQGSAMQCLRVSADKAKVQALTALSLWPLDTMEADPESERRPPTEMRLWDWPPTQDKLVSCLVLDLGKFCSSVGHGEPQV